MIWQGEALILNTVKHSEAAMVVTFFASEGVFSAYVRGAASKKNSAIYQIGNLVSGVKKSRSEDNLGSFSKAEIVKNFNAKFIGSAKKILALKTITEMLSMSVQAGEAYEKLYNDTLTFLDKLCSNDFTLPQYINYELRFLSDIGFGIDLNKCSVTGATEGLFYVSPNTGHAVTRDVGEKYHERLLIIPNFLKNRAGGSEAKFNINECHQAFELTGHFLEQNLFAPHHKKTPYSRNLLIKEFLKEDCSQEIGGQTGPEPTRYGDWEKNGRVSDF